MAFLKDVSIDIPTIEAVPVVKDFLDLFPANLAGMPPDRDIDFGIDLVPGHPSHFYSTVDHEQHLRIILQTLREKKLYAKFSKYEFCLDSVAFLGYVLSSEGIKVDLKKIEAVQSWPRPSSAIEIQRFLGLGRPMWAESMCSLACLPAAERPLTIDVQTLANQLVRLDVSEPSLVLARVVSWLYELIRVRQYDDHYLLVLKDTVQHGDAKEMVRTRTVRQGGHPTVPPVRAMRGRGCDRGRGRGIGAARTTTRAAPADTPVALVQEQVTVVNEPVGPAQAPPVPIVVSAQDVHATSQAGGGTHTLVSRTPDQVVQGLQIPGALPTQPVAATQAHVVPIMSDDEHWRLERFGRLQPPSFSGTEAEDAQGFLDKCQRTLRTTGILETSGVSFTTFQFSGDAFSWWEAYERRRLDVATPFTWKEFSILFLEKFVPQSHREELRRQFEQLYQGDMSVTEYEMRFYELACHAFCQEEHALHLRVVLQRLKGEKLYVKFSKCEFWLSSVAFLGNVVSTKGIQLDPKKIEVVQRKANVVADSLSRKAVSMGSLAFLPIEEIPLAVVVQALANRFMRLDISEPNRVLACVVSRSFLFDRIRERKYDDLHLLVLKDMVQHGDARDVTIGDDGIQERLRTAQSRQKSYADRKVRDMSYMVREKVLLKVSPMKGVMRFGKKGNVEPSVHWAV
ncbi:uncharacterized protein [Nicotiana tomentosiformis]|uniref:uncharacterized protein n=1 Tax=Nicotiana tomentosiformis TaxID=4098 RepID=UPI00388C43A8